MIDEKLKRIVGTWLDGTDIVLLTVSEEELVEQLKQLFIQEAKACLPEREDILKIKAMYANTINTAYYHGFNEAISQAEQNINKLSEEGEK